MTNDQIDRLIARRARLTSRRDGLYSHAALARIDDQLRAAVPFGARSDVDLLLGRSHPEQPDELTRMADQHQDMLDWRWSIGDTAL